MDVLSRTSISALRNALFAAMLCAPGAAAEDVDVEFGGHNKTRAVADIYPADSVFNQLTGTTASSLENELRLNVDVDRGGWSFSGAWQLYGAWGDRVELLRATNGGALPNLGYPPNDDRRLMNLTDVLYNEDRVVALHRLDRLSIGYTGEKFVIRAGRQAVSWGNGLVFSPMDIVNPFDPTAVDTEYKAGDDMIYAQYLRDNGDDVEFAQVFRRDPVTGQAGSSVGTTALKYHGFAGNGEFDVLVADHYEETLIAIGGNRSIGGAVVHGDVVWTDTDAGDRLQVVANASYSWVFGGKNMSGILEYYYNDFGLRRGEYDLEGLLASPDLLDRLARGEAFTVGRQYLAGGLSIEMTPLWMLTPNVYANLEDGSALLQIVSRNSIGNEAELLSALNLPLGPGGSEFGGLGAGMNRRYLSTSLSLFVQFAWYF
jgi:hypothetical protein